jgi:cobalt-zinc-cadmium efflux system protein
LGHHHHHSLEGRALLTAIILNVVITLAQIVGGIWSGSLALLSDAVHNLSDVLSLVITWWANKVSKRPRTEEKTFGYKRAETIVALFNGCVNNFGYSVQKLIK